VFVGNKTGPDGQEEVGLPAGWVEMRTCGPGRSQDLVNWVGQTLMAGKNSGLSG
jgi:hypothetical protein